MRLGSRPAWLETPCVLFLAPKQVAQSLGRWKRSRRQDSDDQGITNDLRGNRPRNEAPYTPRRQGSSWVTPEHPTSCRCRVPAARSPRQQMVGSRSSRCKERSSCKSAIRAGEGGGEAGKRGKTRGPPRGEPRDLPGGFPRGIPPMDPPRDPPKGSPWGIALGDAPQWITPGNPPRVSPPGGGKGAPPSVPVGTLGPLGQVASSGRQPLGAHAKIRKI